MENQHRLIAGYRELGPTEIGLMNEVKAKAEEVRELVEKLHGCLVPLTGGPEEVEVDGVKMLAMSADSEEMYRWLNLGKDHLQQGFMALTRSIARPSTF